MRVNEESVILRVRMTLKDMIGKQLNTLSYAPRPDH